MKVFLSWSGERSKETAVLFQEWIRSVLQAVDPWMSTDIDRGAVWFNQIGNQLADTSIGVIFLTQANKNAPWILFEAGALAKGLPSTTKVCTFLVDLSNADVGLPLSNFNSTQATKENVLGLVKTLNNALPLPLADAVLTRTYDKFWPDFETKFKEIINRAPLVQLVGRSEKEMIEEILETTRSLDKRISVSPESKITWNQPRRLDAFWAVRDKFGETIEALHDGVTRGISRDQLFRQAAMLGIPSDITLRIWEESPKPRSALEVFGPDNTDTPTQG